MPNALNMEYAEQLSYALPGEPGYFVIFVCGDSIIAAVLQWKKKQPAMKTSSVLLRLLLQWFRRPLQISQQKTPLHSPEQVIFNLWETGPHSITQVQLIIV